MAFFVMAELSLQGVNFVFQRVVLFHLALKEAAGQRHFFGNALGREQVDVLELVLAFLEVRHLDKALVDEGVEAKVQAAHAYAKPACQLALGEVGVVLQEAHDPEVGLFLDVDWGAAGHVLGVLGTLPPCRVTIGQRGLQDQRGQKFGALLLKAGRVYRRIAFRSGVEQDYFLVQRVGGAAGAPFR